MTWFKYERVTLIVAVAAVLLAGLTVCAVSWRHMVKTEATAGLVQALATNLSGRVIVYVDIELGDRDGK